MRPDDELFKRSQESVIRRSGELLTSAQLGSVVSSLADKITGRGNVVATPALKHIQSAVQRVLNNYGVVFPLAKVFSSGDYDTFPVDEESDDSFFNQLSRPEIVSRVYALAKPKNANHAVKKKIKNAFGATDKPLNQVLIHTITPRDAGQIFDVNSVTFVVVKADGGLTYCFTLGPNQNLGKVIPEVGLQSEFGQMRDVQGCVDKCPLAATEVSPSDRNYILQELMLLDAHLSVLPETTGKPSWRDAIGKNATKLSVRVRGQQLPSSVQQSVNE